METLKGGGRQLPGHQDLPTLPVITKWVLDWLREVAKGPWGISIFSALACPLCSFYYRCTHCSAEFCMKTDPKNAGGWSAPCRRSCDFCCGSILTCAVRPRELQNKLPRVPPAPLPPSSWGCPSECLAPGTLALACSLPVADYELEAGATCSYEPWRPPLLICASVVPLPHLLPTCLCRL